MVQPDETVFDGFTGLGAFRRHAYYYWWLNRYSLALMTPDERGPELIAALGKNPPAVICIDENTMPLLQPHQTWLSQNYRLLDNPPVFQKR
jgi:hypothetical protein